ncbi:hypothetical protein RGQ29_032080 [Quercus rubra]|uniref:Uncharacterized protein n=1 Tax=Quercus rubra TaxID=3512 RepID=A0AAN7DT53_QUERU|nr:hypothetical protein RGQ29_032080 [Quercus rubra]
MTKRGRNGERKGARAVFLSAKAAGSGVGYGTKGPRTSRRFFFWAAAGGVLILCDNTPERVALLGGQLCDNTPEKAALSCNMLWSQRPYEVVMSFTRSKPGPRAVRKIGRNLSGTTHPTLPPIGGPVGLPQPPPFVTSG